MESKILRYESEDITVTWDMKRCIHAAECVKGLPEVFDPKRKPWIEPSEANAEKVAEVIRRCPTGALQYSISGGAKEQPETPNRLVIDKDGPVYFFGDLEVRDHEDNLILEDTRFALCRCGATGNKPACDNSHAREDWKAPSSCDPERLPEPEQQKNGGTKLVIKLMKNGPAILSGRYVVESAENGKKMSEKGIALCRCGASVSKPFCDGSHKQAGFTG